MKEAARDLGSILSRPTWRRPTSGAMLLLAFLVLTLCSAGPLLGVDRLFDVHLAQQWPAARWPARVLVMLGQQSIALIALLGVTLYFAWRRRSWEPLVTAVAAVLALDLVVGSLKLVTGRESPRLTDDPSFGQGGILYPSGHTANVILIYGLAAYLAGHYGSRGTGLQRKARALAWFAPIVVTLGILYRGGHWVTDLAGGLLIGGAMLRATTSLHRSYVEMRSTRKVRVTAVDPEPPTFPPPRGRQTAGEGVEAVDRADPSDARTRMEIRPTSQGP